MKFGTRMAFGALGALLLVLAWGCDKKGNPFRPPPSPGTQSLQTLWPNEDGRTWNYLATARQWADSGPRYYQDRDSVPPIPSMSQLAALLGSQPIGSNPATDTATYQLKFEGQITTGSGVTAQYLKESVLRPIPGARTSSPSSIGGLPSGFLQDLAIARPDLARRLGLAPSRTFAIADTLIRERGVLFLFGYAWRRTTEWIGSYGDADTALAWKYLVKNVAPGSEFVHRLVPSLAPDLFLHGRILSRQSVQTPAGTYQNVVVCLYAVDYGISEAVDNQNNPAGFFRFYTYGTVAYADSVGPVGSYERRMVGVGNPSSLGFFDMNLALSSSGVAPLAWRQRATSTGEGAIDRTRR